MVEHHFAIVDVEGSSPFTRSSMTITTTASPFNSQYTVTVANGKEEPFVTVHYTDASGDVTMVSGFSGNIALRNLAGCMGYPTVFNYKTLEEEEASVNRSVFKDISLMSFESRLALYARITHGLDNYSGVASILSTGLGPVEYKAFMVACAVI